MCCLNSSISACRSLPPSVLGSPPTGSWNRRMQGCARGCSRREWILMTAMLRLLRILPQTAQLHHHPCRLSSRALPRTRHHLPAAQHPRLCLRLHHRRCPLRSRRALLHHPHQHPLLQASQRLCLDLAMPRLQGAHPVTGQSWSGSRSGRVSAS